jgi:hypothetical protein
MNQLLLEKVTLKKVIEAGSLNTAITGARIGLQKGDKVAVILDLGTATGAVVQVNLRQHNAASGGTSKALLSDNPYFVKAGAATAFSRVQPVAKVSQVDAATDLASVAGYLVIEVLAEQLDVDNGFAWFSVDLIASGVVRTGSAHYVLDNMRYLPAYSESV